MKARHAVVIVFATLAAITGCPSGPDRDQASHDESVEEITQGQLVALENKRPVETEFREIVEQWLTLILAVPVGAVLIVIFLWLRQRPPRQYRQVQRVLHVSRPEPTPHQKQSQDSVTPIDHE